MQSIQHGLQRQHPTHTTGIDHAGACTYLIGDLRSGSGIQAWNSCICKVEKWDGESLPADCLWPQRVIDVEKEA